MKLTKTTLLTSVALLSAIPSLAVAQTSSDDQFIDEVVVTGARGRVENEVEVPIAVTVFTAQEIEDAKIDQVDDFIGLTSGVTIANSQDSGTNFITIRGVSQTRNGEPPVAVVLDGILQIDARAFDQPLFDVDSIEVLKGPQGALYGRNATQGAILINTAGPTDELTGYVQASAGTGNDYSIEGSVSGPITDTLSYRASGKYRDREGQLDNVILGTEVDFVEEIALRGHLNWEVNDWLEADLRGSYTDTSGSALNFTFQGLTIDRVTGFNDGFGTPDADDVDREFFANNLGTDDREIFQLALRLKADLGFAELTSATAYDSITQATTGDQFPYTQATSENAFFNIFGIFSDGTQTQFTDVDAISSELRLTSTTDGPINWLAGAYVLATDRFISTTTGIDLGQGIAEVRREATFNAANPLSSFLADDNDNFAWALFAAVDWSITDRLELSFSGRYDQDRREQAVSLDNATSDFGTVFDPAVDFPGALLTIPTGSPGAVNEETFGSFQPKITARYLLTDESSIYASWGRGFRSGQFNQNGAGAAAAAAGIVGVADLIDQENTETFEIGYKSSWGGRFDFNTALYHTDVENAPYFVFIGAVGAQVLVPIEDVRIQGGEAELSAKISDNFSVYGGVSVSDSEIREYSVDPTAVGNVAPYVPNSTFNAGAQYRAAITEHFGIFLRADYENRGRQFWDPENTTDRSSIDILNLRFGLEDNDGRWTLIGSVDNASDTIYNSEWVAGGFAHSAPPRQFKLDLRYNF